MESSSAPAGLRSPQRYLPQLESLRGWAIILVVLFHYVGILGTGGRFSFESSPVWIQIMAAGNTGVTLFFVLSGFLLVQPFVLAAGSGERVDVVKFYSARILRVVPLYYLAILVAWWITGKTAAFKALLFIPVGFEVFPFSVPWWSLCTELQFYILLPWIMLGLRYRVGRWLVVVAGLSWLVLHIYFFLQPQWLVDHRNDWIQSSIFGRGPAFLVGGLCGWVYLRQGCSWLLDYPRRQALLAAVSLAALLWLMRWYGMTGQKLALTVMPFYHDVEAVLWGGLLLCSLGLANWVKGLFINPLFNHFGSISYSLYLVHVPVQFYLLYPLVASADGALPVLQTLAAVVVSFLVSWGGAILCYRLIELPFLKLKAHLAVFSDRLREHPARA
ncbi:acyltransferase [Pseudomonas sp. GD04158]|uniref:acyltransferase family protein n=1 Tax=Pseudomonas sp. GD04158 TaxID=2975439 RepID=UPI002449B0BC|nr:acyltransferase [Pseudomonas sp. GD04158]MDH0098705.1 acyltransferase [Pseudomonas sp. GD04158]